MRWLKLYEEFEGSKFKIDDVIRCIENDGVIYATIVSDYPDNDPNKPLKPLSVDDDGMVAVEKDGVIYEVDMKNIDKIEVEE